MGPLSFPTIVAPGIILKNFNLSINIKLNVFIYKLTASRKNDSGFRIIKAEIYKKNTFNYRK